YQNITIREDSEDFEARLEHLSAKPDLIFLDLHMEPMDGVAMLQAIRQDETDGATKLISLTASVVDADAKLLTEAGFDGVIAKPLDFDTFPGVLQRVLDGEQVWHIN